MMLCPVTAQRSGQEERKETAEQALDLRLPTDAGMSGILRGMV